MTREERTIKILHSYLPKDEPMNAEDREAFFIAIEALEQKPILDQIRAEIEQDAFKDVNGSKFISVNRINQIIDKYRGEQCQP